jgi:hypothetical protein
MKRESNMTWKRILLLFLVLTVAGAGTALANSVYDYVRAKKMSVNFNGATIESDGFLVQVNKKNVPMADLQAVLNALGGYMRVDEKSGKIDIYKPNVQVTVNLLDSEARNKYTHIHNFTNNHVYNMRFTATVDGVREEIEAWQFIIRDPSGKEINRHTEKGISAKNMASGTITQINMDISIKIEKAGLYTVSFLIKPKGADQFYRVGQSMFESIE